MSTDFINDLATFVGDNTALVKGSNLFGEQLPYETINALGLSIMPGGDMRPEISVFKVLVRVLSRHEDSMQTARDNLMLLFDLFRDNANATGGGERINFEMEAFFIYASMPRNPEPVLIQDNQRAKIYQMFFEFTYRES